MYQTVSLDIASSQDSSLSLEQNTQKSCELQAYLT